MRITENLGLQKPNQNETFDIDVQNSNMDIIDEKFKEFEDSLNSLTASLTNSIAYNSGSVAVTSSSTNVSICSISVTEPGIYLILANTSESISGNTIGGCWIGNSGANSILAGGGARSTNSSGGGRSTWSLAAVTGDSTFSVTSYAYQATSYTISGHIVAIKLSSS